MKHTFCSHCGIQFSSEQISFPKKCASCGEKTYNSPQPVVNLLQPISKDGKIGLLVLRRGRGLGAGKLGLPGGFIEVNETAEEAAIRETKEEIGLDLESAESVMLVESRISTSIVGNLILFCRGLYNLISKIEFVPKIKLTPEATEIGLIYKPTNEILSQFAFSSHAEMIKWFFDHNFSFQKLEIPDDRAYERIL